MAQILSGYLEIACLKTMSNKRITNHRVAALDAIKASSLNGYRVIDATQNAIPSFCRVPSFLGGHSTGNIQNARRSKSYCVDRSFGVHIVVDGFPDAVTIFGAYRLQGVTVDAFLIVCGMTLPIKHKWDLINSHQLWADKKEQTQKVVWKRRRKLLTLAPDCEEK